MSAEHPDSSSERFPEIREAMQVAEEFIELVEELCFDDISEEFGDISILKAEDLEGASPYKAGQYNIAPSGGLELDTVIEMGAAIYIKNDGGIVKEYKIWGDYQLGTVFSYQFTFDPDSSLELLNKFERFGESNYAFPETTASFSGCMQDYRTLMERIKALKAADRLEQTTVEV